MGLSFFAPASSVATPKTLTETQATKQQALKTTAPEEKYYYIVIFPNTRLYKPETPEQAKTILSDSLFQINNLNKQRYQLFEETDRENAITAARETSLHALCYVRLSADKLSYGKNQTLRLIRDPEIPLEKLVSIEYPFCRGFIIKNPEAQPKGSTCRPGA